MRSTSLRQLRAFAAVARHHSFARAAEELHLTPPAVSLQVSQLERDIGLPLFERRGKGVSLTMPGEYLLVYARRILGTLKEAEDAMARLQGAQTGRITIGMVSTAKYFLPRLLARFREEHRGVELRMAIGNREQLIEQLRNAEVDMAVMGRPPRELDARAEMFAEQPHAIVASPLHRLAGAREIPPAMLAGEEFIVREAGSGTRAAMEQFFRDHRIAPPQVMESTSNETIKQAVIANMGLAFLSLHTTGLEMQNGLMVVLDVADLPMLRRWHIVHLQGKPLSPAAEALRYFVLEHGAALIDSQFGRSAGPAPASMQTSGSRSGRKPQRGSMRDAGRGSRQPSGRAAAATGAPRSPSADRRPSEGVTVGATSSPPARLPARQPPAPAVAAAKTPARTRRAAAGRGAPRATATAAPAARAPARKVTPVARRPRRHNRDG